MHMHYTFNLIYYYYIKYIHIMTHYKFIILHLYKFINYFLKNDSINVCFLNFDLVISNS